MIIKPGDILLTRNSTENLTPGYYNHSAITAYLGWVIEAQAEPKMVIGVPVTKFIQRYPEILVLRNIDKSITNMTAVIAPNYLGRKYAPLMSFRPFWLLRKKDSCISLLRRIYYKVENTDYKWKLPDDLLDMKWLIQTRLKKDYKNHTDPKNMYEGMITKWTGKYAS